MNSKQFSILLPIKAEFLSENIISDVYISYKLFWDSKVEVCRISFGLGVPEKITNWESLNEAVKLAAEKDSKRFAPPGRGRAGKVSDDPREMYELEQRIK